MERLRLSHLLAVMLFALVISMPSSLRVVQADQTPPSAAPGVAQQTGLMTVTGYYTGFGGNFIYPNMILNFQIDDNDNLTNPTLGPGNDNTTVEINVFKNGVALVDIPIPEDLTTPGRFVQTFDLLAAPFNGAVNDVFRFRYRDTNTTTGANVNREITISLLGTTATVVLTPDSGVPGNTFQIRVTDLDRNITSGGGNDSIDVDVTNIDAGVPNTLTFTLNESGTPGVFTGNVLNTDTGFNETPIAGQRLRVRYVDVYSTIGLVNNPINTDYDLTATEGSLTISPNTTISRGGALTITVVDSDLNLTPGGSNDTLAAPAVRVRFPAGGAGTVINLTLQETATAGTFSGVFDMSEMNNASGGLATGDEVQVVYFDANGPAQTELIEIAPVQTQIVIPSVVVYGNDIPIQLIDNDDDESDAVNNNYSFIYYRCNPDTGNKVGAVPNIAYAAVEVQPVGDDSGVFEQTIPRIDGTYGYGRVGDGGVLDTPRNGAVCVEVTDNPDENDGSTTRGPFIVRMIENTNATINVIPELGPVGTLVTIQVTDADANQFVGQQTDVVSIRIQNITRNIPNPPLEIDLFELNQDGVFESQINITPDRFSSQIGDTIRFFYDDDQGGGNIVTIFDDFLVANVGEVASLTCTETIPGRPMIVTLVDPDRADASITIEVTNVDTGEEEDVVLVPSDTSTGTFVGTQTTAFGTQSDAEKNGIMTIQGGQSLEFVYVDELTETGQEQTISAECEVLPRRANAPFCDGGTDTPTPVWTAQYFPTRDLSGGPAVTTTETNLSINWEETAPFRQLPADNFSVIWGTSINVVTPGLYTFRLGADDGVRFFIDGQLLLDEFTPGPFRTHYVETTLTVGFHDVRIEYFEDVGAAGILVDCAFTEQAVTAIDSNDNIVQVVPSEANFDEATAHITTGRINVRANPTVDSARIGFVYIYERYPILGVTEDNGWYLIQLDDGTTGWVSTQFVKRYEEIPVEIYPSWIGTEAELPPIDVAGYATAELIIRTGPRSDVQIGLIPQGGAFPIFARTESGAWYRISFDGTEGWVFAPYVEITNGRVWDLPRENP